MVGTSPLYFYHEVIDSTRFGIRCPGWRMNECPPPRFKLHIKGIPFSQEGNIHECIQMPLLLGRKNNIILFAALTHFCNILKKAICRKSPISTGENGGLMSSKITEPR